MQQFLKASLALSLIVALASCGGNAAKNEKGQVTDMKVKLEKLKKDKAGLDAQIRQLEDQINKADPTAANLVQKLVSVDTVLVQDFVHYIELQGKIDAENVSYVAPRGMGGTVKAVYVTEGQVVRKGQSILKLDDAVARQQLAAAQQGISGLEAQLKLAQSVYERQQNLWKQNIGTEVQVLQAKTNAEAVASQLNAAKANVRLAQEQVSQSNVVAEINGTVDRINIKVGEFFAPSSAAMAGVRIVNTSNLKVQIPVPENYLSKVQVGTNLEVVLPELNNRVISTKVSVVSKLIDPVTRSFIIEGKIPSDKDLRPNQIATVRIQDYKASSAVAVPVNVVQTDEKGKYVYVMVTENSKTIARKKVVVVGEVSGGMIEIKSGLSGGEKIVTEGYQSIYDGQGITTGK